MASSPILPRHRAPIAITYIIDVRIRQNINDIYDLFKASGYYSQERSRRLHEALSRSQSAVRAPSYDDLFYLRGFPANNLYAFLLLWLYP